MFKITMFRSQPLLFVRRMPTIKKFKIHPPLPLNSRESKQLLNLLTTNFRQQLDTAHGFRPNQESTTFNIKQTQNGKERRRSQSDTTTRPTDLHISSVLANPLFTGALDDGRPVLEKDPMSLFHMACAKGMMDVQLARHCLIREKNRIIQSPVLSVQQGMKESSAGRQVLKWLVGGGLTTDNTFLKNHQFATVLMEFIVAEGLQEVAWSWIKRAFQELPRYAALSDAEEKKQARKDLVRPLMCLVQAEAHGSISLDSAYLVLSRAAGYLKGIPSSQVMAILGPPGKLLSHMTAIAPPDHQSPSESAFDSFVSLIPVITRDVEYHFACLNLCHPTRPGADTALAYFRKMDTLLTSHESELVPSRTSAHRNFIQLGLKTAKFFTREGAFR